MQDCSITKVTSNRLHAARRLKQVRKKQEQSGSFFHVPRLQVGTTRRSAEEATDLGDTYVVAYLSRGTAAQWAPLKWAMNVMEDGAVEELIICQNVVRS